MFQRFSFSNQKRKWIWRLRVPTWLWWSSETGLIIVNWNLRVYYSYIYVYFYNIIKLMGGKKKPAKKGKGGDDDKYDAAQMTIILGA